MQTEKQGNITFKIWRINHITVIRTLVAKNVSTKM